MVSTCFGLGTERHVLSGFQCNYETITWYMWSIAFYFQVVVLTYEREQVLIDALVRLYGLPFLNKVLAEFTFHGLTVEFHISLGRIVIRATIMRSKQRKSLSKQIENLLSNGPTIPLGCICFDRVLIPLIITFD